ncbi:hypothetical protein N7532_006013 [Penicillium argentinense]|uniref:C2H2-type domain-containing protein n=1 Tax=Penicillium argentinense TaxID=1131581 RepID=A0A9W9FF33_9EURO|nr:uncharacterized protein N7532_006013 [Penicillium argentinense]KAJ5099012.1 hypothetical protein N7532_006013 [Penicillium argentinense]
MEGEFKLSSADCHPSLTVDASREYPNVHTSGPGHTPDHAQYDVESAVPVLQSSINTTPAETRLPPPIPTLTQRQNQPDKMSIAYILTPTDLGSWSDRPTLGLRNDRSPSTGPKVATPQAQIDTAPSSHASEDVPIMPNSFPSSLRFHWQGKLYHVCRVCRRDFRHKRTLDRHMNAKHGRFRPLHYNHSESIFESLDEDRVHEASAGEQTTVPGSGSP